MEPLIKTGQIKLLFKMIKFKARNARPSPIKQGTAIAKFCNAEIDYFELKLTVHVLIRGSLA